jgi:hypothetical protein
MFSVECKGDGLVGAGLEPWPGMRPTQEGRGQADRPGGAFFPQPLRYGTECAIAAKARRAHSRSRSFCLSERSSYEIQLSSQARRLAALTSAATDLDQAIH